MGMWLRPIIQEKSDFVQWEGRFMEFRIQLRSAQDVQEFVSIATRRSFPVRVSNHQHSVNGKNFMEMFSLDVSQPLWVCP